HRKYQQFFFLQAEDGIRDFHVTGVQTCALPISGLISIRTRSISPILVRIKRSVGKPTAEVIRRTWRVRPSQIEISTQDVGTEARRRTGGLRSHNHSASDSFSASAGRVLPS